MATYEIRNPNIEIRSKFRFSNDQICKMLFQCLVFNLEFRSFEIVSNFACLREAASAKAGI